MKFLIVTDVDRLRIWFWKLKTFFDKVEFVNELKNEIDENFWIFWNVSFDVWFRAEDFTEESSIEDMSLFLWH